MKLIQILLVGLLVLLLSCGNQGTTSNTNGTNNTSTNTKSTGITYKEGRKNQDSRDGHYNIRCTYPGFFDANDKALDKVNNRIKAYVDRRIEKFKVRSILHKDLGSSVLQIGYNVDEMNDDFVKVSLSINQQFPDLDKPMLESEIMEFDLNNLK